MTQGYMAMTVLWYCPVNTGWHPVLLNIRNSLREETSMTEVHWHLRRTLAISWHVARTTGPICHWHCWRDRDLAPSESESDARRCLLPAGCQCLQTCQVRSGQVRS